MRTFGDWNIQTEKQEERQINRLDRLALTMMASFLLEARKHNNLRFQIDYSH